MAYSIVAACVMLLRFETDNDVVIYHPDSRSIGFSKLFNINGLKEPTTFTSGLVTILVTLYTMLCVWMALTIKFFGSKILDADIVGIVLLSIPIVLIVFVMIIIARQPRSSKVLTFSVPFTPWFPALSIMVNIYLMTELDVATWIRFGVWILVGLLIYFFYSRRYSALNNNSNSIDNKAN